MRIRRTRATGTQRPLADVGLIRFRRASNGSVGAPASPGHPLDDRILSWMLKMARNLLKHTISVFYVINDSIQSEVSFSNCSKVSFCNSYSLSYHKRKTIEKIKFCVYIIGSEVI